MYNDTKFCVKTRNGVTDSFISDSGVLQGCNLSPTLSNIFQNDLHETFIGEMDSLCLNDTEINALSWADDLIIMSSSRAGLQRRLNKLESYCWKWGLSVNTLKTKVMVMEKGFSKEIRDNLTLLGDNLEYVRHFKYLGIIVNYDGSFKRTIADRIEKATKCIHSIRNAISNHTNISCRLAESIFEKQISPILLYGCPLWSLPQVNNTIYIYKALSDGGSKHISEIVNNISSRTLSYDIRIYKAKNMASIRFETNEDKCHFLSCIHKKPISFNVIDPDNFTVDIDKVQAKFMKFVLGVSKFTSNTAVFNELGIIPILNKAKRLTLMYYHRLENEIFHDNYPLLFAAYQDMKTYNHSWLENVRVAFSSMGMGHLYTRSNIMSKSVFKLRIKTRLQDIAIQQNRELLSDKPYLTDLVALLKGSQYRKQKYIELIKSPSHRAMYAKIRTNNTKLSGCPYNVVTKICDKCNTTCDFKHILLECSCSITHREKFYDNIAINYPN